MTGTGVTSLGGNAVMSPPVGRLGSIYDRDLRLADERDLFADALVGLGGELLGAPDDAP